MQRFLSSVAALAVMSGVVVPTTAFAVPAVFFNEDLAVGRTRFLTTVGAADAAFNAANPGSTRASTIFEIDIMNNTTNANGVFSLVNGATTVFVRSTRLGNPVLNNSSGNLGNSGYTNWSNSYGGGFANAEALGYTLSFFSDAGLTTPFVMNAIGLDVNDWGTCCASQNPTPDGSLVDQTQIYLRFRADAGADSTILLGGLAGDINGREHFIGAVNDVDFFNRVTVIANGNGEFFGAGNRLLISSVALNSVPPGLSDVSGEGLIGGGGGPPRLFWDGAGPASNNIIEGGAGTWSTTSGNFTDAAGALAGPQTPQSGVVNFTGTGGVVTVSNSSGAVRVGGMSFDVDGYTIAGDVVDLTGMMPAQFTVANAAHRAVITAPLSGVGLQKLGAGALALNNAATSIGPVTVSAGRLSGNFTANGLTLADGTTLAPGASIGTITSTAPVEFQAGSRLEVELTSTGMADRINVTGAAGVGTATISSTDTVLAFTKLDAPRFVLGTRYTLINAAAGRTGAFARLAGPTRVSRFIDVVQETDANNLYLAVRQTGRFGNAARNINQLGPSVGVDAAGNGEVFTAIAFLDTDGQAQFAFDQVSGEVHASLRGMAFEDSRFVRDAVTEHLLNPEQARKGLWMHGYGSWGRYAADGNAARVQRDIGGFFMGADVINTDTATLGVVTGYGSGTVTVADRGSRVGVDDFYLGAYGSYGISGITLRAGTGYQWRRASSTRTIAFTGFTDQAFVRYQSRVFQVYGDVSYDFKFGQTTLSPFGSAAYVNVNSDRWKEDARSAFLTANRQSIQFWTTSLGARVEQRFGGDGQFGAFLSGAWRYVGGPDRRTPLAVQFNAGPEYQIFSTAIAKSAGTVQARVFGEIGPNVSLEGGYSGVFASGRQDHGFNAQLSLRF